jgi:cyclopropane-fatty-acyl-phospholipid synthase
MPPRKKVDHSKEITLKLLEELFKAEFRQGIQVQLWDGTLWPDAQPRSVTLVLKHPGALREMLISGTELGMGEAYIYNDIDVLGDFEKIFGLADALTKQITSIRKQVRLARPLMRLPSKLRVKEARRGPAKLKGKEHSIERDRQAVTYHYDVSNDFFTLYLDRNLVYSCAYFKTPEDSLDQAQENKLELVCRKLRLKPGQRLLDIGCGWGSLVIYAAKHYGVDASGITLSSPQAGLANRRIAEAGLGERCRVLVQDYRQVEEANPYDALVSIGMIEHVGAEMQYTYFKKAFQLLKPAGVFLNHGISKRQGEPPADPLSFSLHYVFPDSDMTPLNDTLNTAELVGFEVRDVESLRENYILTLRHWVRRLEASHEKALQIVDEATYRVWRMYMSGAAHYFSTGFNNLYQVLLVKPGPKGVSGLPLTREDWYR